jgi:hypothetical protein
MLAGPSQALLADRNPDLPGGYVTFSAVASRLKICITVFLLSASNSCPVIRNNQTLPFCRRRNSDWHRRRFSGT